MCDSTRNYVVVYHQKPIGIAGTPFQVPVNPLSEVPHTEVRDRCVETLRAPVPPRLLCDEMNCLRKRCPVISLWSLGSLWQLLHDVDQFVRPVPSGADVDTEEVFLGGGRHGKRMPLQLRNGRTVEEDVLPHVHLKAALHQLQLQHFGRSHHNLKVRVQSI